MQIKKKIAGRFSTRLAYSIIKQVSLKTNIDNSFVTALIPANLSLSESQIEILSQQLEYIQGEDGYCVEICEDVPKIPDGIPLSKIPKNSRHYIRKGLIEELGMFFA